GFSRGAAEARVFCSWLKDACDGGGGELTLCGIPVQLDLLGIFDTVASVGLANSSRLWSGHGGYASEDDLRIAPYVRRCVHLVAAHEVRGSFPLDAAAGVNGEEVVYPGVHSDVGGGYEPGEQGKAFIGDSIDDSAKLSQIALCHMYREAMAAGVPLNLSASRLSKETKAAFKVDKGLIDAFNGYVAATGSIKASTTVALTQAHYALYLRWRRLRLDDTAPDGMAQQPFVTRARTYKAQDVTDLLQTNAELRQEWAALQQDEKDAAYSSEASVAHVLRSTLAPIAARDDIVALVWGEKMTQWREVKPAWNDLSPLDRRIVRLHDDYSHDSRAWFKPFGAASEEAWKRQYRQRMNRLEAQDNAWQQWNRDVQPVIDDAVRKAQKHPGSFQPTPEVRPMPPLVAGQDLKDLKQWRSNGGVIPTEQDGRESYGMFGFLRWRTIFVPEKSALAHSIDAVDETLEQIKQLPGKAKQAVGDAVESAVDSAVEAGKDFVGDQVRKLIPSGLPRM
ncbi:T6SS phospholipase effector Tle1-like catalytic domain-containing protein, partial [Xanthomonas oryzae]